MRVCSKVLALANQLVKLDAALLPLVGGSGSDRTRSIAEGSWRRVEHHCCQITAASIAIAACACICNGSAARWERGDAFRLTAAASLVLNSGEAAVAVLLEACDKPVPDDALYGMMDV